MDVDEGWTFSSYTPVSSDEEEESDEMDVDVDLWPTSEVEDVEMFDMTSESNDTHSEKESSCLEALAHRWRIPGGF